MKFSEKTQEFSCACANGHRTYGWKRSGFLIIIMATLMLAALVVPYITVIARHLLPAFIPFVSQSGGEPPQTGIFAIFLILVGFSGILLFPLYLETIKHRNRLNNKWIIRMNRSTLPLLGLSCLGCIITAAFPVGFTEVPNLFEYVSTVLLFHAIGATTVLTNIAIFQFVLAGIWWLLPDVTRTAKFIKIAFCFVYIICFFGTIKPSYTFVHEELGPEPFNLEFLRNVTTFELPTRFSTSYQILAVAEWAVCLFSFANFLTTYKDLQRISFHITMRHKSCLLVTPEPGHELPMKALPV